LGIRKKLVCVKIKKALRELTTNDARNGDSGGQSEAAG
jgi:hypothetical protein